MIGIYTCSHRQYSYSDIYMLVRKRVYTHARAHININIWWKSKKEKFPFQVYPPATDLSSKHWVTKTSVKICLDNDGFLLTIFPLGSWRWHETVQLHEWMDVSFRLGTGHTWVTCPKGCYLDKWWDQDEAVYWWTNRPTIDTNNTGIRLRPSEAQQVSAPRTTPPNQVTSHR